MTFLSSAVLILAVAGTPVTFSPVVAEVNGEVITRHDVKIMVSAIFKQLEARYEGEALEEKKREYLKQVVDHLIEQKLLVQAARERGIEVEEEDVDSRMEALAEKVGGWPVLLDMLAKAGISFEERARQVREAMMVNNLLSLEILPKIYASPSDVKRYYEDHRDEFTEPSQYKIRQIIVWKSRYVTADKAMEKLEMVREKLEKGGDFTEIAQKHSDGPHAKDGGDWGFVGPGDLVGELASVLRGMKVGEVRGAVETRVGFHFVKLVDMKDPTLRSFADVHQEINRTLRKHAYSLESERYIKDLRRKGFVKVYEQAALSAE